MNSRVLVILLSTAFVAVACGPSGGPPPANLTVQDFAGGWVGHDADGWTYALRCGGDGRFAQVISEKPDKTCRQVGHFWIEDGRFVWRYRTNDCNPDWADRGIANVIESFGGGEFRLSMGAYMVEYERGDVDLAL